MRSATGEAAAAMGERIESMRIALEARLTSLATDMAQRLEQVKGELRQETADRLNRAFQEVLTCLERQLSTGRDEQRQALSQGILQLEQRFQTLQGATEQRLGVLAATQEESLAKSRAELAEALHPRPEVQSLLQERSFIGPPGNNPNSSWTCPESGPHSPAPNIP